MTFGNTRQSHNTGILLKGALSLLLCVGAVSQTFSPASGFAEDSSAQSNQSEGTKSKGKDLAPLKNFSSGFSKLLSAPKQKEAADESTDVAAASAPQPKQPTSSFKGTPIPTNVGAVLQIPSLAVLDSAVSQFFQQTSETNLSILTSLKLTAYRGALNCVDVNAPAQILVFTETTPPQLAVLLPVGNKQLLPFLNAVTKAADSGKPKVDGKTQTGTFTLNLSEPVNLIARQVSDQYIVVTSADSTLALDSFEPSNLTNQTANIVPEGIRSPILSISVTATGLQEISKSDRPFWQELSEILTLLKKDFPALSEVNLDEIHRYIAENLNGVRYDLGVNNYGLYAALQLQAKPKSQAAKQLASYREPYPFNPSPDRFFSVLPDVESAIAGQADLSAALTETLPKPFNRVRFVEYCLGLPADNELAAESFLFYIEVDDTEEFAREMIIPRAREIGRYVGSKQAAEAASQLMGGLAERRQARQQGRRIPERRQANPERAAEIGGALGTAIGGLIGESAGEESAMKEYRLNGFKMYVSDIETFTRQSALMKAEKESLVAPETKRVGMGSFSPAEALVTALQNTDSLQRNLLQSANQEAAKIAPTSLFARQGFLVILDKNTILYGLGNQELLKLAVNNYRSTKESAVRYLTTVQDVDGITALANLASVIPNLDETNVIGAMRIDAAGAQAYYGWLQKNYFPEAPVLTQSQLPATTPKLLVVSSVLPQRSVQRFVLPHKTVANFVQTFAGGATLPELLLKPKTTKNTATAPPDDDFEVDFGDE